MDGGSIEKLIQGVIKEYKVAAGGNVNAGDLVSFITNYQEVTGTDETEINTDKITILSAVALNDTKVFVAYSVYDTQVNVYGIVCEFNNSTINIGNKTLIASSTNYNSTYKVTNTFYKLFTVKLTENKVFITYTGMAPTYNNAGVYYIVCTIYNLTISLGAITSYDAEINGNYNKRITGLSVEALSADTIVVSEAAARSYPGGHFLENEIIIIKTSGTNIQKYASKFVFQISTYGTPRTKVVSLNENKIAVIYIKDASSNNPIAYINIGTINDTSIRNGNRYKFFSSIK